MDLLLYENRVMQIGAWKSYYELEDSMTLNELIELYGGIVDKETTDFKRLASLEGVDLDKGADDEKDRAERFREYVAKKNGKQVADEAIPGVGQISV